MPADLTPLQRWKRIVLKCFPYLSKWGINPVTKALRLRSANGLLELEGGGPAAARTGDFVVRLGLSAGVPSYSASTGAPYTWLPIPAGTGPGGALLTTDAGVAVTITTGSGKVQIG